jgi:hypothetical protein
MPFAKRTLKVETGDGRFFDLLEPLVYTTNSGEVITVPIGCTTDGASTPREIWNIIPPFGTYWLAAVLHDYLYRITERSKAECDHLLLEAMISLGVDEALRNAIYEGVHIGGTVSFDEDRKINLIEKAKADAQALWNKVLAGL